MKRIVFDLAALIARIVVGVIFVAHGWQKWQTGLGATAQGFRQAGVPSPDLAAGFATVAETLGGAFLIIGFLVRLAALALLLNMIGAFLFVHAGHGIFVQNHGWELAGALGMVSLLLLALGGGRWGVDGIIGSVFRRRADRGAAEYDLSRHAPPTSIAPTSLSGTRSPQPEYERTPTPAQETCQMPEEELRQHTTGHLKPAEQVKPAEQGTVPMRGKTQEEAEPGRETSEPPRPSPKHPAAGPSAPSVPRQPDAPRGHPLSDEEMREIERTTGDPARWHPPTR